MKKAFLLLSVFLVVSATSYGQRKKKNEVEQPKPQTSVEMSLTPIVGNQVQDPASQRLDQSPSEELVYAPPKEQQQIEEAPLDVRAETLELTDWYYTASLGGVVPGRFTDFDKFYMSFIRNAYEKYPVEITTKVDSTTYKNVGIPLTYGGRYAKRMESKEGITWALFNNGDVFLYRQDLELDERAAKKKGRELSKLDSLEQVNYFKGCLGEITRFDVVPEADMSGQYKDPVFVGKRRWEIFLREWDLNADFSIKQSPERVFGFKRELPKGTTVEGLLAQNEAMFPWHKRIPHYTKDYVLRVIPYKGRFALEISYVADFAGNMKQETIVPYPEATFNHFIDCANGDKYQVSMEEADLVTVMVFPRKGGTDLKLNEKKSQTVKIRIKRGGDVEPDKYEILPEEK